MHGQTFTMPIPTISSHMIRSRSVFQAEERRHGSTAEGGESPEGTLWLSDFCGGFRLCFWKYAADIVAARR